MKRFEIASQLSNIIQSLAFKSMKELSPSQHAYQVARKRTICPVDYMRYAEFEAVSRGLDISPKMKILDVSSPQWFSICLAYKNPQTEFQYINITDNELDPYREIVHVLGIKNLIYQKGDVRNLAFDDNIYDKVISLSVIEHVFPEEDGDLIALKEVKRVLKPGADFCLTVLFKHESNIVYIDGPVYERVGNQNNFFAREYDKTMFDKLIYKSGFSISQSWYISEKRGISSLDYYEWGPGKDIWLMKYIIKSRKLLEIIIGKSIDQALAKRNLDITREIYTGRLVNIAAVLNNT